MNDDLITRRDVGIFALKALVVSILGTLAFMVVAGFAPNHVTASNLVVGAIATNLMGLALVLLYIWLYYHPAYQDEEEEETPGLHSGVCIECERNVTALSPSGLCEGCTMEAMIESQ